MVARLGGGWNVEATTARPGVSAAGLGAILVVQASNDVFIEILLRGVLGKVDVRNGNVDSREIVLPWDSVILGRPADAKIAANLGDRVGTSLATVFVLAVVSSRPRLGHGLIGTRLLTRAAVRARESIVRVIVRLLVVAIGVIGIELSKLLGIKREATGITSAVTVAIGPRLVLGVEAPVNAVGVRVSFSMRSEQKEDRGGNEGQGSFGEAHVDGHVCKAEDGIERRKDGGGEPSI